MRHRVAGRQLSRTTAHRKALRRNLAASLIEHGAVRTTPAKAKEVRAFVERLISIARQGTLHARRRVIALLQDRAMVNKDKPEELADLSVIQKLFEEVAPRYLDRPGGYTRIIRLPERRIGDAGQQVLLQLIEQPGRAAAAEAPATTARRRRRAARRAEAARSVQEQPQAEAPPAEQEAPAEPAEEAPADQGKQTSEDAGRKKKG